MNKIFAPLIFVLAAVPLHARTSADTPRLIVGITVDQLRTDYIDIMSHLFGQRGINRLVKEGLVYENLGYGYTGVSRASSVATVYTGAYPSEHSIVSNTLFDRTNKSVCPSLYDEHQLGNFTSQTLSPKMLAVSTISDELKVATLGKSKICSVAADADLAIISAGHAGDAAFWYNPENGKWATSTYYKYLPPYITDFNTRNTIDVRIDTMRWAPLLKASEYDAIPYTLPESLFSYKFEGKDKYSKLKQTPLINSEITRLACAFITEGRLGSGDTPDMLNIGYYAGPYFGHSAQDYGAELQDAYIRLDRNIETLLDCIDKSVGLQNALIFVVSTGYANSEGRPYGMYGIPTGEFYPRRAVALLNYYLMAVYGQEDWVLGYNDREIYLNRELISAKELDLNEFSIKSAEFLSQMAGVQEALTSRQILYEDISAVTALRRRYHRKISGDIILSIQPGWEINYENGDEIKDYVHYNAVPATLIFLGKNITPQRITIPVAVTRIAPTISKAIRIRAPSASAEIALPELK